MSRKERTFDMLNRASVERTRYSERQIEALFDKVPGKKLPKAGMTLQQMDRVVDSYRVRFDYRHEGQWVNHVISTGNKRRLADLYELALCVMGDHPNVRYRAMCFDGDETVFSVERYQPKAKRT